MDCHGLGLHFSGLITSWLHEPFCPLSSFILSCYCLFICGTVALFLEGRRPFGGLSILFMDMLHPVGWSEGLGVSDLSASEGVASEVVAPRRHRPQAEDRRVTHRPVGGGTEIQKDFHGVCVLGDVLQYIGQPCSLVNVPCHESLHSTMQSYSSP